MPIRTLTFRTAAGSIPIRVEIAATIDSRRTGLMYRRSLASNAGMVFLWFSPVNGAFWMKNTLIPLSIAFWDGRGRIHTILDMQPCASEPCPFYYARQPYVGAVEVNQGFLAAHGVVVADRVDIAG